MITPTTSPAQDAYAELQNMHQIYAGLFPAKFILMSDHFKTHLLLTQHLLASMIASAEAKFSELL